MFTVELENMVDEGEVTAGDLGAIEELAEPLHVEDADAQKLLVKLVTERCSSGLLQATADLRGSDQPAAATELGRVLKFGLAPEVAEGGVALLDLGGREAGSSSCTGRTRSPPARPTRRKRRASRSSRRCSGCGATTPSSRPAEAGLRVWACGIGRWGARARRRVRCVVCG